MSRDILRFVIALFREQERIGQRRPSDRHSWYEATVIGMGKVEADRIRNRGAVKINRLGDQAAKSHGEIAIIDGNLALLDRQPVCGVHSELLTSEQAEQRQETVAADIEKDTRTGSLKHHRVPMAMRWIARLLPVIDLPVLTMFSADIFNLSWDSAFEGGNIVRLLTSITFGFLGTVVLAAAMHKAGTELRQHKNDHGGVDWPSGRGALLLTALLGGVVFIGIGAAVLMGYRVMAEAFVAETSPIGGVILGLFFAGVVATSNIVVLLTVFRDGSLLTEELDHLYRQLLPIRLRRLRLHQQRNQVAAQIQVHIGKAEQVHAKALVRMSRPIEASHRIVGTARSLHQGCGWSAELLSPDRGAFGLFAPLVTGDTTVLDQALARLVALRTDDLANREPDDASAPEASVRAADSNGAVTTAVVSSAA